MNNRVALIAGGASLVSATAGVVGGYLYARKRLSTAFEVELEQQLEAAEEVFKMKHKVGMYANPEDLVQRRVPAGEVTKAQVDAARVAYGKVSDLDEDDLQRIIKGLRRDDHPVPDPPVEEEESLLGLDADEDVQVVDVNVFSGADDDLYYPTYEEYLEENPRGDEEPYIITAAEFFNGHLDQDTASLTWYDEDGVTGKGVLVDARDTPVDIADEVVGLKHMDMFGMWSDQMNLVFICNPKLGLNFEVIRHRGSYADAIGMRVPEKTKKRRSKDEPANR